MKSCKITFRDIKEAFKTYSGRQKVLRKLKKRVKSMMESAATLVVTLEASGKAASAADEALKASEHSTGDT